MRIKRVVSRAVAIALAAAVALGALTPLTVKDASAAQSSTVLALNVPAMWENTLTPELLSQFEAQYNARVVLTFSDTAFFGFGGPVSSIEDDLDATEETVSLADVIYVDSSSLSVSDTQAGYYLDLTPLVMSDPNLDTNDFYAPVWQSFQWDNGTWAIPLSSDVVLVTYDPVAFDEAGLAYPNERWTIDDFANAARALTQYNADGTIAQAGMTTNSGGDNLNVFVRALAGVGFYDSTSVPNTPDLTNPSLESMLDAWYEIWEEGIATDAGGGRDSDIPLRIEGVFGYAGLQGRNRQSDDTTVRYASLLPGGTAGLSVQGFAVSAGTQSPEVAYQLAAWLTTISDIANNQFSVAPARYSLAGTATTNTNNGGGPGGGQGGGPGGFNLSSNIPDEIQPVVDQGLTVGLPVSELRYASYLRGAINQMSTNGGDALSALQSVEAQAATDTQTAIARNGTVSLYVEPPVEEQPLAAGEIELTCALNLGIGGGRGGGGQLTNQDQWDQLVADYVASDPLVGAITLETTNQTDLATLAEEYDCFILPTNAVTGSDVSSILNLDPLLDTDPTFDRNDILGNTLTQVQQDNLTWALPLSIAPQMLEYSPTLFAQAGVPEPANGWTVDTFVDALRMLDAYNPDTAPFVPNDPSGSYLLMLIGAFGGLPIDYRTDPATISFTDPTNVDAIRQVLDLAIDGYLQYTSLVAVANAGTEASEIAITTNSLNSLQAQFGGGQGRNAVTTITTTYPQGSQYGVLAYEITTGYISGMAQSPESAYGFLSAVASQPELFSGMPVRQSQINDPDVVAAQGQEVVTLYQQLDALLSSPNTLTFPSFTAGRGSIASMAQQYWLFQAFDAYINESADLEYELSEAETKTLAYQECIAGFESDPSAADERGEAMFEQIRSCASAVDPDFAF